LLRKQRKTLGVHFFLPHLVGLLMKLVRTVQCSSPRGQVSRDVAVSR